MKRILLSVILALTAFCSNAAILGSFGAQSAQAYGMFHAASGFTCTTYATWNPADKNANITLSNGNLTATGSVVGSSVRSTISKSSGTWYWEVTLGSGTAVTVGVANSTMNLATIDYVGKDTNGQSYYVNGSAYYNNGFTAFGAAYVAGDVIGLTMNAANGNITMYKNNVLQGTIANAVTGPYFAGITVSSTENMTANFGATTFAYPTRPAADGAVAGLCN